MNTAGKNINGLMEEHLVKLCKKGDNKAQRILYDRYSGGMLRLCLRYVKNISDAEDILVTGFLKIFEKISRFEYRGPGSLSAWIKKIIINESLMFLRQNNNFRLIPENNLPDKESDISLDNQINAEEIYKLILKLPIGYRTVFNMFAIEGYSHKEIADKLNISENTSKSQLFKAREMLKQLIIKNNVLYES